MTPFISGVLAFCWLGERLSLFQVVMMCFCFGGITLVTLSKHDAQGDDSKTHFGAYEAGIALCGTLVLVFALAAVTTRRLKGLHFSIIQFYISLCGFVASAIWIFILWTQKGVFSF